ncbi:MAG TPA: FliI/YscN family ATPase [Myxococcota bacterium]|nr:FliI/YscN family ATPase [Myxococcota bacterium]HRY92527.1 FliI/YscN family ATPase [Myxococcota bacterium]
MDRSRVELLGELRAEVRSRAAVRLAAVEPCRRTGRLVEALGATLVAELPGARVGELVRLGPEGAQAEVVGFAGGRVVLLPVGGRAGLAPGLPVQGTGRVARVAFGPGLLGRVLDPLGRALDGRPAPVCPGSRPLDAAAPAPLARAPISRPLPTGVRAVDGLACLGEGQRVGLFAGPGAGKSSLLGLIARGAAVDCAVVCLVGERGREVGEFLADVLGQAGLARAVVVCATSDLPAGERARALPMATALAEGFRDQGQRVLLLVDSLTRHARALREIAVSAGEPQGRRGFPPSVLERLAAAVERTGAAARGSITAVYSVLTEGDGEDDPLAEEVRSLLDGHLVLDPGLARAGCFPALDPARSLSRLMPRLVPAAHQAAADAVRAAFEAYEQARPLIAAGAYEPGADPELDRAVALRRAALSFLRQGPGEVSAFADSQAALLALAAGGGA